MTLSAEWESAKPSLESEWEAAAPKKPKKEFDTNLSFAEKLASSLPEWAQKAIMGIDGGNLRGSATGRMMQGMADPGVGLAQLAANAVGKGGSVNQAIAEKEAEYQAARKAAGSEGFDPMRMAGNVAISALPLSRVAPVVNTTGRIGQGLSIGAISGAANPVTEGDFSKQKAEQVGIGAIGGALLPAGWELAKTGGRGVRNIVQSFSESGIDKILGRQLNLNAGDKKDEIVKLLMSAQSKTGGPITAGEAAVPANRAEFAAFQDLAKSANPSLYAGNGVEGAQEAARMSALKSFGQDKQALKDAIAKRAAEAATDYGKAFGQAVKVDPELAALSKDPYFQKALPTALDLAKSNGINPKTDTTQFLQYIKSGLDKQLSKDAKEPLGEMERKAVAELKTKLLDWMDTRNLDFKRARNNFQVNSVEPNQMMIGQELMDKLGTPLGAGERAAAFAQAMKDAPKTIKNATGSSVYQDIEKALLPQNLRQAQNVLSDLENKAAFSELSRAGMQKARDNVGVGMPTIPSQGFFDPRISAARAFINRAVGKEHGRVLERAGEVMLDPQMTAKLMESATPYQRQRIIDELIKYQAAAIGQGESK